MNKTEKESYLERVRNWNGGDRNLLRPRMEDGTAVFQNVIAAAAAWSDAEVKAFDEGCVLVTALIGIAESGWLPDKIYSVSAKRAIRFITKSLDDISHQYGSAVSGGGNAGPKIAYFGDGAADTSKKTDTKGGVMREQGAAFVAAMEQEKTGNPGTRELWLEQPKHLDQYIHLLPEATQKKAADIKALFMQLDEARENGRLLMEDPRSDAATRAHWMSKATSIDNKIRAIFKEVDAEWAKLVQSGRVVVDDLGMAKLVTEAQPSKAETEHPSEGSSGAAEENQEKEPEKEPGEKPSGESSDAAEEPKKRGRKPLTEEEKAARKKAAKLREATLIRKWLIDTRYANTDEHNKKWLKKYGEMVRLGGEDTVTDKVREAAEFYGIALTNERPPSPLKGSVEAPEPPEGER